MAGPLALIAEITHRCPLHCVYCSNPLEMKSRTEELPTAAWIDAFEQTAALGALQLDLTGGEPLARADLTELVAACLLYTSFVLTLARRDKWEKVFDKYVALVYLVSN